MTLSGQLDRWEKQGAISPEQHALLDGLSRGKPFSLFLELNTLLYAGVLAFIGGLGWTVHEYSQQLGDVVIVGVLSAILVACGWYCFAKAVPYSRAETPSPNLISDYVLYLGSLTWTLELAYLENRFHLMSGQWDDYLLATAGVFFLLAYRFDNRFVLSLALTSLAGWFGLTVSHWPNTNEAACRYYAMFYSALVGGAGIGLQRIGVKRHFVGTYLNVAANVLLAAVLSGVFQRSGFVVWFLILLANCGGSLAYGISRRQFSFVAYAAIYGYIGVSSVLVRDVSDWSALLSYFLITGIAMVVALWMVAPAIWEGAMRAYAASDEEALHTLDYLQDWMSEGLINGVQQQELAKDIECGLRRTKAFLRIVLFIFALIASGAAIGLVYTQLPHLEARPAGILLIVFAVCFYAGAEYAVYEWKLYRHGIEEALAVLSIGFLSGGTAMVLSSHDFLAAGLAGAIASFLLYCRFGLQYLFAAGMILLAFVPQYWTTSHAGQHLIVAGFYAAGLIVMATVRPAHMLDFLDGDYSVVEAMLWFGLYLALNLQLSPGSPTSFWRNAAMGTAEYSATFYWITYALIWCLPAVMVWRALTMKDRTVWVGLIMASLTLVTNKSYLGWELHPWDPILLGVLLTGVAVVLRRWLEGGPAGVRNGFTARRLSGRDKLLMNSISMSLGVALPNPATMAQTHSDGHRFGGGDADGGGASSTF